MGSMGYVFLGILRNVQISFSAEHLLAVALFLLYHFLNQLFGCPRTNFGALVRGQSHWPVANHCALSYLTQRSPGAS